MCRIHTSYLLEVMTYSYIILLGRQAVKIAEFHDLGDLTFLLMPRRQRVVR